MDLHNDSIRGNVRFGQVPKIGLQYGPAEYFSINFPTISMNDEVFWCFEKGKRPLAGKVQFIGQKQDQGSEEEENPEIAAVVSFNQPTCNLPGHLTNPPCNRNLVPVNQLTKTAPEIIEEDIVDNISVDFVGQQSTVAQPKIDKVQTNPKRACKKVELIGNCFAVHKCFKKAAVNGFRKGDSVYLQVESTIINGKIVITGTITSDSDDDEAVRCIGVKFNNSIGNVSSELILKHLKKDVRSCKECAGDTLAFIPTQLIGHKNGSGIHLGLGDGGKVAGETEPTNNVTEVQNEPKSTPRAKQNKTRVRVPAYLGNCVAVSNGITKCTVKEIKTGESVKARNGQKTLRGTTVMICTINDLPNSSYDTYVGIRFKSSFDDLCSSKDMILHSAEQINKSPNASNSCSKCDGGKLVFVPADFFLGKKSDDEGIKFELS